MNASHPQKSSRIAIIAALALVAGCLGGCDKLKARDLLNQGTQAYKDGQTDKAIEDFKQATELDPTLLMARLYLATAYQGQFIPGAPSEENKRNGTQALQAIHDDYSQRLNQQSDQVDQQTLDDIRSAVAAIAKQKGLSVVFDSTYAIYTANDITQAVIAKLNGGSK